MSVLPTGIAAPTGGYEISRSVRLRSSASAYFNRTPASAGNRNVWTISFWFKRGKLGSAQACYSAGTGLNVDSITVTSSDKITIDLNNTTILLTSQVFRDPSAWYHLVFAVDTSQATASNRAKLYINGSLVTAFDTDNRSSITNNLPITNTTNLHKYGYYDAGILYSDVYYAEINGVDGQQLTPSSFGSTNALTGVWQPARYTGTYGTNGYYLNFSDNSAATAAAIGKDSSGNGNNWTPNNISVTAGSTYDSMTDVPTLNSATAANFAVWNCVQSSGTYPATFSNGNLKVTSNASSAGQTSQVTTISMPATGNWYAEITVENKSASAQHLIGIVSDTYNPSSASDNPFTLTSIGYGYNNDGNKRTNSTNTAYGATWTTGNVIGIHLNNGTLTFYKDGTSQGSAFTGLTGNYYFAVAGYNSDIYVLNAGQQPFTHTPPTGFKALNTSNLPDSTITKGSKYFDTTLWTGDGASSKVITSGVDTVDFAWVKKRSGIDDHRLANTVTGGNKHLKSNATDVESTGTTIIQSFSGSTFTVGSDASVNGSGATYVGWTWKESVASGFDIVTFTNPSSGSSSFAHSLGVKPSMIIVKSRSNTSNWTCTHKSLGTNMADKWINLESTAAVQTSSNIWGGEPTSSVFYCGTGIQVASATMVAYLFAEVAGYSKFGSYTGNGSTDGPFVYLGFKPRFVMVKRTDTSDDWVMIDTSRNTYNVMGSALYPNSASAETNNGWYNSDVTSNGFKIRASNAPLNASGGTYIYAAFAENPFKNSLAR